MAKHRVILIGCGIMAKQHVARFENVADRVEISAVADVVKERAQAVSDLLPNHPPVFTDYHDALPHGEAVLQSLPHHLHAQCVIDCLDAGLHVLSEKPLANSEEECLAMIEAARRNKRILMVAYCMRFHPLLREMRRLIEEETFGKCFQLSIWTEQLTMLRSEWLGDRRTLGGGQLFSHGCHYIDLMLWMMGNPVSGAHFGTNLGTPWMDREGTSNVCLQFESGALGYHFGTWGARGTKMGYDFQAHCEQGLIQLDYYGGKLIFRCKDPEHVPGQAVTSEETVLMEFPKAKPTAEEMAHFIDCIETGKTPETTPEDSLQGLRVIWKLYEAEDAGRLADLRGLGFSGEKK